MFTHYNLKVYQKAVVFAAAAGKRARPWGNRHAVVDHLGRASESMVLNLAEAARLFSGPAKAKTLEYAIGSTLECAACFDIALIKDPLPARKALDAKRRLLEITRMLIGLRKS